MVYVNCSKVHYLVLFRLPDFLKQPSNLLGGLLADYLVHQPTTQQPYQTYRKDMICCKLQS